MIDTNVFIRGDTSITWKASNQTFWVSIGRSSPRLTIFVESADDAKRLVRTLWVIREHIAQREAK